MSLAEKLKDGGSSECSGAEEPSQGEGEEEEHGWMHETSAQTWCTGKT